MQKQSAPKQSKSLKTFFLYAALVIFVISVSLAIKLFFVIQQSKFDGKQQFVVAITKGNVVGELITFQPATSTITVMQLQGRRMPVDELGKVLGVIPDATVTTNDTLPQGDPANTMSAIAMRYHMLKTNMTLVDVARLAFIAKKTSPNAITNEVITTPVNDVATENTIKKLISDEAIIGENKSVQIINASNQPGLGGRLEYVISNMGGNVVSVTTSHSKISESSISYFGESSYTLEKLHNLLGYPIQKLSKETLADIVITIGENNKGEKRF